MDTDAKSTAPKSSPPRRSQGSVRETGYYSSDRPLLRRRTFPSVLNGQEVGVLAALKSYALVLVVLQLKQPHRCRSATKRAAVLRLVSVQAPVISRIASWKVRPRTCKSGLSALRRSKL